MSYITMLRDGLWPGGQLKAAGSVRTAEERLRSRDEANRKLSALIPGAMSSYMCLLKRTCTHVNL